MNRLLRFLIILALSSFHVQAQMPRRGNEPPVGGDSTNSAKQGDRLRVDGEYLRAFMVALESLVNEPPMVGQRTNVDNYDVYFSKDDKNFTILFLIRTNFPDKKILGGGSELGRDVEFTIDKVSFTVVKRTLFQ